MKVKRHKHASKVLSFYKTNFQFTTPYHILVDGTFCKAALRFKVNISEQLPKYLESETKLCTTKCVLAECEAFGPVLYGPLKVLKQFDVVKCPHPKPIEAAICIRKTAMKQENSKYVVATQDGDLSERVREAAGIPLLFISHNCITLEAPSSTSREHVASVLAGKLTPSEREQQALSAIKKEVLGEDAEQPKKKRKKIKGPNPLSCKPKTKKSSEESESVKRKRQRKRKRVRIPEHVKSHLKADSNNL